MATNAEKMDKYKGDALKQLNNAGVNDVDMELLHSLAERMKSMLDNRDAVLVSVSDKSELETVRKNFVVKKLGVEDKDKAMTAIHAAGDKMKGDRNKNRAAFYYLVQKELGM